MFASLQVSKLLTNNAAVGCLCDTIHLPVALNPDKNTQMRRGFFAGFTGQYPSKALSELEAERSRPTR